MEFKGKIIVTNNGTIITPYEKGNAVILEKVTSTYDEVYHKRVEQTGFIMKYNNNTAFITHNNNERWLRNFFPEYEYFHMPKNRPSKMKYGFHLNDNIEPTDIQFNIISEILKDKDKDKKIQKEWFVNLQTGYGKTLLSVYLSSILQYKTLIMCSFRDVLKQWMDTIKNKTNFDMSRVLLIDSSKILLSMFEGNFDADNYDVFICTPSLITKFSKKYGNEKLWKVFEVMGIGLKIFDEAHLNKANIVKINALTNVKYTLYLSADFAQGNLELQKMYYRIFNKTLIIKPSEDDMIDMRYTRAIVVEYNSRPSETETMSIYNKYGFSPQFYIDYQFDKGYVFEVLTYIINNIIKSNQKNYKILILLVNIDHIDILKSILEEKYGDRYIIGRYHSNVNNEEKEYVKSNANIIISTYASFGTGVDVSNIKYVISINQCNKIMDNQAAGRARPMIDGSDVFYFMLIDRGFNYCIKKLKTRLQYLAETKIKDITKIKYNI